MEVKNGVLISVNYNDIVDGTFSSWEGISSIGEKAFCSLSNLTHIEIPNHIISIAIDAFCNCKNLTSVKIGEGVTEVGDNCFANCSNLKEVRFSEGIKEISKRMFYNCDSLEEIIMPNSVKIVGECAFYGCSSLKNVLLSNKLERIDMSAFENCHNLNDIEFPNTLYFIGTSAFLNCDNLKSVKIPYKVEELLSYTFSGCKNLEKIILSNNLVYIGTFAFERCHSLKNIKLPNSLKSIGESAFLICESLSGIKIPDGVKVIHEDTFKYCSSLKNVKLPSNLLCIEKQAFDYCSSIKKISIPKSCKLIDENAFYNCDNIDKIEYDNQIFKIKVYKELFDEDIDFNTNFIRVITNCELKVEDKILSSVKFPCGFLALLNRKQFEEIIKQENLKHFKDIYTSHLNYPYDYNSLVGFYKFAYCIGCFENKNELMNGKNVNVSQKACVFLKQALDNGDFNIDYYWYQYFKDLKVEVATTDLLKFISQKNGSKGYIHYENFDYLLDNEKSFSRIINNFDKIMNEVIIDDKGRIITNPSIRRRIGSYLNSNNFDNVKEGNEDILDEFERFHSLTQKHFDIAQSIREEAKGVTHHLVSEELEENIIIDEIEKIKKNIGYTVLKSKELIKELIDLEFTYEWLDKHDPKNFVLGLYTDCCASIASIYYGKDITKESIVNENVQNLVIRDKEGEIIAKATIYVNKEKGYAVFNDMEIKRIYGDEKGEHDFSDDTQRIKIYKAFKRGVEAFVNKYNEINKETPIKQVNIGWGANKLKQVIKKYEKRSEELFRVIDCFKDAKDEQWIVYKK